MDADHDDPVPSYERSARRHAGPWMMLLVGAGMACAGFTVDPARNCGSNGECAPWLVPVALVLGLVFAAAGLGQLLINPRCGSRLDALSGELVWWQQRIGRAAGLEGRIHPSAIGRIRIRRLDGGDRLSLYDHAGERQPHFDAEVVPWPIDAWVQRLVARWPHIEVDDDA